MDKYVRLAKTVNTPGSLLPIAEVLDRTKLASILSSSPNSDWYTSVYHYPEEGKKYYETNHKSIAGYSGPAFSTSLVFDFDSKNPELARQDAVKLLERLTVDIPNLPNCCNVYFSGSKGFHIDIKLPIQLTPIELKEICVNMSEDLPTFDVKVYNATRLFRLPNTKHADTGLYKVELSPEELRDLSIDEIKKLATAPREEFVAFPVPDPTFISKYKNVVKPKSIVVDIHAIDGIRGLDSIDFSKCPKHIPRCIFALSHGIMISGIGERSATFLRLAAFYRNQGMNKDLVYNTLKGISRLNGNLYPEFDPFNKKEIWNNIVSVAFAETPSNKVNPGGWGTDPSNDLLLKYCNAIKDDCRCLLHSKKDSISLVDTDSIAERFNNYAVNFDKNLVRTGINFLDENLKLSVGTVNILAACNGTGKTSMLMTILKNANNENFRSAMFSMDMGSNLLFLKLAALTSNYSYDEIFNFYKQKDKKKIDEIRYNISSNFNKTTFDFTTTQDLDDIRLKIDQIEQKHGEKVKFCAVDYMGRLSGKYQDSGANASSNALKSVDVASSADVALLMLTQVARHQGDGKTPLRSSRISRDSGQIEDCASSVTSMWRPFLGKEDDNYCRLYIAKNRFGKISEGLLGWDGKKGLVYDLSPEELAWYKQNLEHLEEQDIKKTFGN